MVQYSFSRADGVDGVDDVFAALADPTRRAILVRLRQGDASVSELAEPFSLTLPGVTKHLRVLERAGLLEHEKIGRVRRCRVVAEQLRVAMDWLETYTSFWSVQLDALKAISERGE